MADPLDKLTRAIQMEEEMAAALIDLCPLDTPVEGLAPKTQERIRRALVAMKKDTLRHKKIVSAIKENWNRK